MLKFIVLLTLLVASTAADFWSGCSDLPSAIVPSAITSDQCSDTKCTMTRGKPLNAHVAFTLLRQHEYLNVAIKGTMYGINIDLYDIKENICDMMYDENDDVTGCPTEPDIDNGWKMKFTISTIFPAYNNALLRFELKENDVTEICFEITADVL